MDKLRLRLTVQDADPNNVTGLGAGAIDTIGEASALDIGTSGDMKVTVIAQTVNQLNLDHHQLRHPFN